MITKMTTTTMLFNNYYNKRTSIKLGCDIIVISLVVNIIVIVVVVVVNAVAITLLVVTDHIIFSCGQ